MDEWSDREGDTLASDDPGAFQNAMQSAIYTHLKELTVPARQRFHSGMITVSSRGMASSFALSRFRCAITSSGGVWVSHSERERSW